MVDYSGSRKITILHVDSSPEQLIEASELAQTGRAETTFIWIVGEASWAGELRRTLIRDYGVDKDNIQFTGYWKSA